MAHVVLWPLLVVMIFAYISPYIHPEKAWWIAFFGLAYPVIMVIALIFLLIFLLLRSKRWRMLLVVFLFGLPIHLRYVSPTWSNWSDDNDLHVMSYNVRLFDYYEWINIERENTRDGIYMSIETATPDVLCLQEYLIDLKQPHFINAAAIKKIGGFNDYRENFVLTRPARKIGVATFSKFPIIGSGLIAAEHSDKQFAQYTDIVKENDTFRVYNIHLQSVQISSDDYDLFNTNEGISSESKNRVMRVVRQLKNAYPLRVKQAETIIQHALSSPFPVIICGDFNDPPISYVYNLFNQHYTDAFRGNHFGIGSTYAGKLPAGRIDYIFHDTRLKSHAFRIQNEVLSDHFAIETTISWTKEK
jgi:endonuclease/exonuclease/phosphatase family metal-dependent hydrolase